MGHARALLSLRTNEERLSLWHKIENLGLSVRQVEKMVVREGGMIVRRRRRSADNKPPHIRDLEERLLAALGTKVAIVPIKENSGRIVIDYYSLDDFDRIVERILDKRGPAID